MIIFIECEMESINYIVLMTSVADTKEAFTILKKALSRIDNKLKKSKINVIEKPVLPKKNM